MTNHVTERLKSLRNRAGMSMSSMAQILGFRGASSYQRYEDAALFRDQYLPQHIIRKLVEALVGKGEPVITREEVLLLADPDIMILGRNLGVRFGGHVEAGNFRRNEFFNQESELRFIPIAPDPRFPASRQYAFRVFGDSMNQANIVEGMWVVAVDLDCWEKQFGDIEDRALVVVSQSIYGNPERELTIKRLRIFRDRMELRPESSNPKHQSIVYSSPPQDSAGKEVSIIGVLISAVWLFGSI